MTTAASVRRMVALAAFAFAVSNSAEVLARSKAAKELVREFKIDTYTATRKDDNFYDIIEGYVVKTRYCYVYAFSESVVITKNKMIFIDSDDVCDIDGVYRK